MSKSNTAVAVATTQTEASVKSTKKVISADQQTKMDAVVQGLGEGAGKSAKIRALHASGFEKADIARYLGVIYQHVRNVLVTKTKRHVPE